MRICWNKKLGASDPVRTKITFLKEKAEEIPCVGDVLPCVLVL